MRKYRRVVSFGMVGLINTLVDFAVYSICVSVVGLSPEKGQAAGYCAGFFSSFFLNRRFTFKDASRAAVLQFILFLLVNAASLLFTTYFIGVLVSYGMNDGLAKITVTACSMVINYFGYKLIAFRSREDGDSVENEEEKF